jgi:RimJ/RimL family protein N-acetyltransferase
MSLTISTPRLTLRPPEPRDADAIARAVADYDIAKMSAMIPHPYPAEVADGWIMFQSAQARRKQAFNFVIDVAGEGVLGSCGVFRRRPYTDWEVGYWVAKPAWGRGIATEALAATVAWARAVIAPPRLTAGHFLDNPASRRVLEKVGFRPTGHSSPLYSLARNGQVTCVGMALELDAAEAAA